MSQEELMNHAYQESEYKVSLYNADSVVSEVEDEEKKKKRKAVSEMIRRINKKVDEFYIKNGWVALSVDIPMTEEVARNSEYIKEITDCLVSMNWNVRTEGVDSGKDAKFVIKPRNWWYNKKDQHGKRGKQSPSFLTTFGVIIIAAIVVGAFIKG